MAVAAAAVNQFQTITHVVGINTVGIYTAPGPTYSSADGGSIVFDGSNDSNHLKGTNRVQRVYKTPLTTKSHEQMMNY